MNYPIGKILVLPKRLAAEFTSDEPWAAISISTHDDWPTLNKCQQIDLLQLSFADLDEITPSVLEKYPDLENRLFTEEHAKTILDFVQKHWDNIEILLIHCYAGAARSPAVGAAIAKIYYGEDNEFFKRHTPRMRIYRMLLKEAFNRGLVTDIPPMYEAAPPNID